MLDAFHTLLIVSLSIGCATCVELHGHEPPVHYGAPGTVGVPEGSLHHMLLFSEEYTNVEAVDAAAVRPFLVLSEEDSIESVKKEILATKPIRVDPHQVWMPEWPEDVDFSKEIQAALEIQRAIRTDKLTPLQHAWTAHIQRSTPDRNRSDAVRISIDVSGSSDQLDLRMACPPHSIWMTFYGHTRRLRMFTVERGGSRVVMLFYSNGVPFVLHSGSARALFGWQIRWLPNGKVSRAIYLKEPWFWLPPPCQ